MRKSSLPAGIEPQPSDFRGPVDQEQWTGNPKAAGLNPVVLLFRIACFLVVAVLVALPLASALVTFKPEARKAIK